MNTDLLAGLTPAQSWFVIGFVSIVLLGFTYGVAAALDDLEDWRARRRQRAHDEQHARFAEHVLRNVEPVSIDRERELATLMGHRYSPREPVVRVVMFPRRES